MMKYLLLLILPFLSNAVVNGLSVSTDAMAGNNSWSVDSENHANGAVSARDTHAIMEESLMMSWKMQLSLLLKTVFQFRWEHIKINQMLIRFTEELKISLTLR